MFLFKDTLFKMFGPFYCRYFLLYFSSCSLNYSAPKFLFVSFWWFIVVKLFILFMYHFLILFNCLSMLFCCIRFLETVILNFLSGKSPISIFFSSIIVDCYLLVMTFLWFFMFLEILCYCFCILKYQTSQFFPNYHLVGDIFC